jgi:hypothetical protein
MKFSAVSLAVGAFCYLSAVVATPAQGQCSLSQLYILFFFLASTLSAPRLLVYGLMLTVYCPPGSAEEARGYGGVVPPCANIRCAYGAPYYDRKTRRCLCPPINCPAVTLCLVGNEAYYDWKRRDCNCRPFAAAH